MAFSQVFGHTRPLAILRRALTTGRVAHAYLFAGAEGMGKASVAWNFAKALVCRSRGDDVCDACDACRKVNHGNHPDVIKIEARGQQIRIEQIRDVQRHMVHRPLEGRWRVTIIDRAHDLTAQAANALLKVLEEPPEGNVIVLIARSAESLIPTIVSRCQILHFVPLTPAEVARYLQEKEGWEPDEAHEVSIQAQGNIKRALDLKDKPLLQEEMALIDLLENLRTMRAPQVLERASVWAEGRKDVRLKLECMQGIFRDLVQLHLGCASMDHKGLDDRLLVVAAKWSLEDLVEGWGYVVESLLGIERNYNTHLVMDHLLLRLYELSKDKPRKMRVPRALMGERS